MKIDKKFFNIGRSKGIVIPMIWIRSQENESGRKMVGVSVNINDSLKLTPIFGEKIPKTDEE